MEGWIKVHRKIVKWEWFDDGNTFKLFMYLLLMANHKDGNWRGHEVKRGQFITGRKKLAKALRMGEQSVRTSLNKLKSTNEITIESTSQWSRITIANYNAYNDKETANDHQSNQQSNKPATNDQPTTNHKQECNNDKNEKKKTSKRKSAEWVQLKPPTLEMIKAFCIEKGFIIDAETFYNHYTCHDDDDSKWRNNKGEEVKSWKGTANTWNGRRLEDIRKEKGNEYDAKAEAEGLEFIPRHLRNNNEDAYGRGKFVM